MELGWIVKVKVNGDPIGWPEAWLGRRIYMSYRSAVVVKHNLQMANRYRWVTIVRAKEEDHANALDVMPIPEFEIEHEKKLNALGSYSGYPYGPKN